MGQAGGSNGADTLRPLTGSEELVNPMRVWKPASREVIGTANGQARRDHFGSQIRRERGKSAA